MHLESAKKYIVVVFLVGLVFLCGKLKAGSGFLENGDADTTVYIIDKSDLLSIRFYPLVKTNSLEILVPDEKLSMEPHGSLSLGLGFNYKFLGLGLALGIPTSAESNEIYGKTRRFDFQVSYYGKRLAADGFFQRYKGYYLKNPTDFMAWNKPDYPQTEDLRVFSIGGSAFYIFNSDKFSYKAAYLRNEIQTKSAGSFTAGIFVFHDEVISEDGFIPDDFPDSIRTQFDIKEFDANSIGITAGYMYTFVIRGNFFINLALAPGVGYRRFRVVDLNNESFIINTSGVQLQAKIALGYEFKGFYLGATSSTIFRNYKHEDSEINLGAGQVRFTIGKRFDVSRK